MASQRNPLLWLVSWKEPSGKRASWQTLAQHEGQAVYWLLKQRPYLFTAEGLAEITVKPWQR